MDPIVAGGLVLGTTVIALVFVGLCNAMAERLYARFFQAQEAETARIVNNFVRPDERKSA